MRYKRRTHRDYGGDEESIGEDLAAINDRLDELTRHLERVAQSGGRRGAARDDEHAPDRVSEALARLDRRLDQVITEARSAPIEAQRRMLQAAPPPPPPPAPSGPNWAAEISARQRALDGGAAAAMRAPAWQAPAPSQDLSALENHLRQITTQIASLHQPYEDALSALRSDLAEVGRALKDAMPRQAVETLEAEIRALSDRVGRSRQAGGDPAALAGLEQGLAEVRDALRNLAPAENLIGFEDAVRGLSHKIDQLGAGGGTGPEPAVFHQLEEAIAAMRHIGSHVASDGALAQLAAEVHGLATRFEQATANSGGNESLAKLESRISALMESGRSLPPDLEASIHALSERFDRMQLSQGDQFALGGLEDRIVKLVERLDTCDARLGNLDAIERGMADVLIHLQEMRQTEARGPRAAMPAVAEPAPAAPEPPIPPAPQLLAPPVFATPAPASADVFEPQPTAVVRAPPSPKPAPPRAERRPIEPNLPPDTPLEPGSGAPRSKPGSSAARIAASEAALGGARPAVSEIGGKSAAIAAARSAAMSYQGDGNEDAAPKRKFSWFKSSKPKAPKPPKPPKPAKAPKPPKFVDPNAPRPSMRQRVVKQLKTLAIAISVVIIVLGTLQTAMDYFMAPEQPQTQATPAEDRAPDAPTAPATAPAATPRRPMPTPDSMPPPEPTPEPGTTQSINRTSSMFDPSTVLSAKQQPANADVTGSIGRQTPTQRQTPAPAATPDAAVNALSAPFGPVLRAAAAGGDQSAEFEIASRFAEGRGVARNMEEAVRWLERAAGAGFVPAQFRLAGIHEKGDGVKKDIITARKLYIAAAEKGHAKAMHNLAVLYAEGVDGKPDYRIAAQWFRKAAAHGVADSQFNLAILYARGIGIEQNLAESYKWFALAAGTGDQDAAKKRDEVATRLDQPTLMAAKLAAQTFTAQREPDEATNLKTPQAAGIGRPRPRSRPNRSLARARLPRRERDAARRQISPAPHGRA